MTKLKNTVVDRGGETAPRWKREAKADPRVRSAEKDHSIIIAFKIPSAGGGTTDVMLTVGRDDFARLFEAMVQAGGET